MPSIKTLVIIVTDYPFGMGEPYLEDELRILETAFSKIYLLQSLSIDKKKNVYNFYVPENAEVIPLTFNLKDRGLLTNITQLFSFRLLRETFLALFKHRISLSTGLLRLIYSYWKGSYPALKAIRLLINENQIEIEKTVFYSYWFDYYTIALARLKRNNPRVSFSTRVHGWDLYFERHQIPFLPFREFVFNNINQIFPISNDGKKYILDKKLSIHPSKIAVASLGVKELKRNVNYSSEIQQTKGNLTILTLSHINLVKRLDRLVNSIAKVNSFNITWHHIGLGAELYEKQFKEQVYSLLNAKSNVIYTFHGELSKDKVEHFIQETSIDVIINCSDTEGVPVSIMEAMSVGIPAIAFDVGGVASIVENGKNGILLKVTNDSAVEKLTNAIKQFYSFTRKEKLFLSDNALDMWGKNYNHKINYTLMSEMLTNNTPESPKVFCEQCLIGNDIYPDIVLDKYGKCDVCSIVEEKNFNLQQRREAGYLSDLLKEIKSKKGKKQYDCIIGISGGVDSAYLALKVNDLGLTPLLVHIDNGWNSEIAVHNIQALVKQLDLDLYTVVIDWHEVKDLVRSFLKASVIDIDWANEMCAQAAIYKVARKFKVKYILTGHQMATEGWMPDNVVHYKLDLINFKHIHKKFGEVKLKTYPLIGFGLTYYLENILGVKYYFPLDYMDYNKENAKRELVEEYGWTDYGQKHFESIFTRFYQGYILPNKFKIDKRRFHYSSEIVSGQLSKEEAQKFIESNEYVESGQMQQDKEYVIKKLEFTEEEFDDIIQAPPKKHTDYPSVINILRKLKKIKGVFKNNR